MSLLLTFSPVFFKMSTFSVSTRVQEIICFPVFISSSFWRHQSRNCHPSNIICRPCNVLSAHQRFRPLDDTKLNQIQKWWWRRCTRRTISIIINIIFIVAEIENPFHLLWLCAKLRFICRRRKKHRRKTLSCIKCVDLNLFGINFVLISTFTRRDEQEKSGSTCRIENSFIVCEMMNILAWHP